MKTPLIIGSIVVAVLVGYAASPSKTVFHKVLYQNKTGGTVYVWHWLNEQVPCKSSQFKLTLTKDENLSHTYGARFYIRVTSADDSCADPRMKRFVGEQDETIEIR